MWTSQEETPGQQLNQTLPWDFGLQSCEEMHVCGLSTWSGVVWSGPSACPWGQAAMQPVVTGSQ